MQKHPGRSSSLPVCRSDLRSNVKSVSLVVRVFELASDRFHPIDGEWRCSAQGLPDRNDRPYHFCVTGRDEDLISDLQREAACPVPAALL